MVTDKTGITGNDLMLKMSNDPSFATMETENGATTSAIEETPSQWVAFSNPTPFIVKARFNITGIELPPDHSVGDEPDPSAEDGTFLQMLIEEGIPVNYTSTENPSKEPDNVGVILDPLDPIAEETLNLVPQSLDLQNAGIEEPTNNVDNIVEVTGCSKPISTPLFLHLVPSSTSLQDGVIAPGTPDLKEDRRGSIDPAIIKLPSEVKALPVKKKVRFDLPGRKASLIGEYEILRKPVVPYRKDHPNKHKYTKFRRNFTSAEESSENEDENRPMRKRKRKSKRHATGSNEIAESSGSECEKGKMVKRNGIDNNEETNQDSGNSSQEYYDDSINSTEYEMDSHCGLGSWNPKWLQIFARNECYLAVFCLVTLAQGMFWNYNKVILSTFQKRFRLTDIQAGYISSGNNIAQMTISIFVAFYATYQNRLKWLGSAALCSAFAAILAASPHLFYGSGEFAAQVAKNSNETLIPPWWKPKSPLKIELCNTGNLFPENCPSEAFPSETSTYILPTLLLFSSQLLMGFANSVFWTIGVAYLDDNISKKKASLHIAFFTVTMVIGPRLGVSLGARCLSLWIDPTDKVTISPHHPNWIGAWWPGFLIISVLIACPGFMYFWFPKQMYRKSRAHYQFGSPLRNMGGGKEALCAEETTSFDSVSSKLSRSHSPRLTELLRGLKRLFSNKVWVANLFSSVFFALAMSNYFRYKNIFILFHFRKSASSLGFPYSGTASTIATVVGICISAVVMRWYRPRARYVTAYNVFLSIYGIVSLFVLMTIHCRSNEVAGHLPGQEKWACSRDCNCSETFMPICADDGVTTFYSPCFAGCSQMDLRVTPPLFVNCSCFGKQKWKDYLDEEEPSTIPIIEGRAIAGYCPNKCNAITTYLSIQILSKLVFASGRIGGTLINIRSVADSDKTLALGCFTMFITLAGLIPTSLILGKAVDSACLAWEMHCGKKGGCSFYDVNKFRLLLHGIPAAFLMLSCIGDLIVHMNNFSLNLYGESLIQDDDLQYKEARNSTLIKSDRKRERQEFAKNQ